MTDHPQNINNIPPGEGANNEIPHDQQDLTERIDRLGGEPAPDISAEEFARLQRSGNVQLDSMGRVRANLNEEIDAGVSLRKRRAWYGE